MNDLYLPVLLGTARQGRRSETVARYVIDEIKQRGIRTELLDVRDHSFTGTHDGSGDGADYRDALAEADGLVIVAPEYNHGYPGELKLLLDSTFEGYRRKPLAIVSVSAGLMGGARMVEQLRLVGIGLGMVPVSAAVHVPSVAESFDEHGDLVVPGLHKAFSTMLDETVWYAQALRPARNG